MSFKKDSKDKKVEKEPIKPLGDEKINEAQRKWVCRINFVRTFAFEQRQNSAGYYEVQKWHEQWGEETTRLGIKKPRLAGKLNPDWGYHQSQKERRNWLELARTWGKRGLSRAWFCKF